MLTILDIVLFTLLKSAIFNVIASGLCLALIALIGISGNLHLIPTSMTS